jgi:hypothetical protein
MGRLSRLRLHLLADGACSRPDPAPSLEPAEATAPSTGARPQPGPGVTPRGIRALWLRPDPGRQPAPPRPDVGSAPGWRLQLRVSTPGSRPRPWAPALGSSLPGSGSGLPASAPISQPGFGPGPGFRPPRPGSGLPAPAPDLRPGLPSTPQSAATRRRRIQATPTPDPAVAVGADPARGCGLPRSTYGPWPTTPTPTAQPGPGRRLGSGRRLGPGLDLQPWFTDRRLDLQPLGRGQLQPGT